MHESYSILSPVLPSFTAVAAAAEFSYAEAAVAGKMFKMKENLGVVESGRVSGSL